MRGRGPAQAGRAMMIRPAGARNGATRGGGRALDRRRHSV